MGPSLGSNKDNNGKLRFWKCGAHCGRIGCSGLRPALLVDNHEVEAGDTGKDLLSLSAVCCVPVTVQVAMLLNVPSVANHLQSFDQVGICLIEMLIGFVTQSPACSTVS